MENIIVGLFLASIGAIFIMYRAGVVEYTARCQNRFWGEVYDKKAKKRGEWLMVFFGSILLISGILFCIQIFKLGHRIGQ
jgi:hypothetical protein